MQQRGHFCVHGEMSNPAQPAKLLLHERDLEVAGLTRDGAGKRRTAFRGLRKLLAIQRFENCFGSL